eukprot:1161963-Pelagomonas_calceolata.AAC.12
MKCAASICGRRWLTEEHCMNEHIWGLAAPSQSLRGRGSEGLGEPLSRDCQTLSARQGHQNNHPPNPKHHKCFGTHYFKCEVMADAVLNAKHEAAEATSISAASGTLEGLPKFH